MQNRLSDEVPPNNLEPSEGPAPPTGATGPPRRRVRIGAIDIGVELAVGLVVTLAFAISVPVVTNALFTPDAPPPSTLPSFMTSGFPHEDSALESLMPRSVDELQLTVWSVRGQHILEAQGDSNLPAVLTRLGRTVEDASMAVAGRSAATDPPNWTFAYRIEGMSGKAIGDAFQAIKPLPSPPFDTRTIDGKTVLFADGGTGNSSVIVYAAADAYFMLLAPDAASAVAMLKQVDQGSGE